jgi:hypothetical protein
MAHSYPELPELFTTPDRYRKTQQDIGRVKEGGRQSFPGYRFRNKIHTFIIVPRE